MRPFSGTEEESWEDELESGRSGMAARSSWGTSRCSRLRSLVPMNGGLSLWNDWTERAWRGCMEGIS